MDSVLCVRVAWPAKFVIPHSANPASIVILVKRVTPVNVLFAKSVTLVSTVLDMKGNKEIL